MVTSATLPAVQSLWIGSRLGLMEKLTIRSFLDHGHDFILWGYEPIEALDPEVEMRDANEILPFERVFRYVGGEFPGSVAGFSDIFRFKLLWERGGWWVDMDVTCLRPFDFDHEVLIRPHPGLARCCGNILRAPAGSDLMRRCYSDAVAAITTTNTDWLLPLRILSRHVDQLGLRHCIAPESWFGTDAEEQWQPLFASQAQPRGERFAIHWCNEWLRFLGFDKNAPVAGSFYDQLLRRHRILETS